MLLGEMLHDRAPHTVSTQKLPKDDALALHVTFRDISFRREDMLSSMCTSPFVRRLNSFLSLKTSNYMFRQTPF